MSLRRALSLLLVASVALSGCGVLGDAVSLGVVPSGGARGASAAPRRALASFFGGNKEERKKAQTQELEKTEALAGKAIDAALAAGDVEGAEVQQEMLETMEEKVMEVTAAEEKEEQHAAAAEAAAEEGDVSEAETQIDMAEDAAEEAEEASEELGDAMMAEQELAEMSLAERLSPTTFVNALSEYSPQVYGGASAAVGGAREAVRSKLDVTLGNYPVFATFLEWVSLLAPIGMLAAGFAVLRRGSTGAFSLRSEALLLSHLYWAGYFLLLAVFTAAMPAEPPLVAFATSHPDQYVAYQVLLLIMLMAYMVLLVAHFAGERTPASAMQLLGGALVYIHSYLTVTHPAVKAALPPTTKGPMWFFLYALIFMSMTGLLKRERHGKGE